MAIFQIFLIIVIGLVIGSVAYSSGIEGLSVLLMGMFITIILYVLISTFDVGKENKKIKQVTIYNQEQEVIYDFTASEISYNKNGIIGYTDEDGLGHEIYFGDGIAIINELPTDLANSKS